MKQSYHFLFIFFLICFTSKLYSQSVPSYVPTNGLVGWWGFNGNANDQSGNNNIGSILGGSFANDRNGLLNSALFLPNLGDYSIVNNTTPPFNNFELSASVWLKIPNQYIYSTLTVIKNGVPHTNGFILMIDQNHGYGVNNYSVIFLVGNGTGVSFITNQSELGQWSQLTSTYDGSSIKIYLNGILKASQTFNLSLNCPNNNLIFGKWDNPSTPSVTSRLLDDIGIWNRALTQQEITNLYNSQLPTQTSLCLPIITTNTPTSIGIDSVVIGGDILNDGGSSIVLRGVCYSTTPNPNMGNPRTEEGSGMGSFTSTLRNLSPSTTYFARSYAKNSQGVVVYGNEVSFSTGTPAPSFLCGTSTVTDVDGNNYNTVQIGTQCWTQSNLKVSKYRNGDNIPTGLSNSAWENTTAGAYAIFNNDPVNDGLYGKLYNHYAVLDTRGLCPTGWHVPTDGEWNVMVKFLDPNADTVCSSCVQSGIAGGALKSTFTQPTPGGWNSPNAGATNSLGFSAGPGGLRNFYGDFLVVGNFGYWWSSSSSGANAWYRRLSSNNGSVARVNSNRANGFSVRCLRD